MVQIDIDIPGNCVECPIHNGEYGWCNANKDISVNVEERPRKCPLIESEHGKVFKGIVVEYPLYNTYPEYIGKPYFSIKYTENGQEFIGYGTYKPEVLSEYLITYFMPSAQPDRSCIDQIKWKRDTAIQQLNELGYSFGEAIRHDKDTINRKGAINAVCTVLYPDADKMNDAKKVLKEMPPAQPEYYDYSDIEPLWKYFAEENDINLTDTAKQLKDAMWCGYRKGKADAQPEQRWVPCSEEPDNNRAVFIARGEPKFMSVCIGYYDHDFKQWYESRNWFAKCLYDGLYWCDRPPLPEPYREEGE